MAEPLLRPLSSLLENPPMRTRISELTRTVDSHGLFDFGKACYGQLEIEISPTPGRGDLFEVVLGECAANGHVAYTGGFRTFRQFTFTLVPGQSVYPIPLPPHLPAYGAGMPHFPAPPECQGEVTVFRYVEVNHCWGTRVTVRRKEFYNDVPEEASRFHSSQLALDQVWEFCRHTLLATSIFPCYLDGERERMPYEGDAYITQLSHFCCGNDYTIARNTIQHFLDHGDKTWPTEWLLCTPFLVRDYLLYSGDHQSVQAWLPHLPQKLLPQHFREDGLLAPTGFVRDIVDWPPGERDGYEMGTANFVPNAYAYGAMKVMAELTGDEAYLRRAEALKTAIFRAFRDTGGGFVDSVGSRHTALHTAVFALRFGLAEGDEAERCRGILREKGMACSVYAAQFLLESCFRGGLDDLGVALITSRGERSWLHMMEQGATITMEAWDDQRKRNQDWSHPWGAAPGNIIPRFLVGVRPLAPGFRRFQVKPSPAAPASLVFRQPTPFGAILVQKEGDKVEVSLQETSLTLRETALGEYQVGES